MPTRRIDLLISQARRATENEEFSDTTGIDDAEFIQYFNDAQHRLQAVITALHPTIFVKEGTIVASPRVEAYDLPEDVYLNNKITLVEYTDVSPNDYYKLGASTLQNRDSSFYGTPCKYIRRSGQILLSPIPQSTGTIRINYAYKIRELDKRRGVVSTVTLNSVDSTITSLVLDTGGNPPIDSTSLSEHDYICVVDKNGNIKMKNIPVDTVDTATGAVTISSGFTYSSGETISAGDYIVGGQNTSTHSELPRSVERYLLSYASFKIFKRDSSVDSSEAQAELLAMEDDIVNSYAHVSDDVTLIPDINGDDWWV